MYQAGIRNITLYENKGLTFTFFDVLNPNAITNLNNLGEIITIANVQQPEFDIKPKISKSGNVTQDFALSFYLLGLTQESYDTLSKLATSLTGWCFLVEFYDGSYKFYNVPVFFSEAPIKPHNEMAFAVKMETAVPTTKNYFDYTKDVFLPFYRFDTMELTWDSEIYTFDYEL